MKLFPTFLLIPLLLNISTPYLKAQVRDSTRKKPVSNNSILKNPTYNQINIDTVPKKQVPVRTNPSDNNNNDNREDPPRRYIPLDTIRPVPVETQTYVGSVLRLQKIYVNNDALELIKLLNPGLANMQTVMSNYKLVLPQFPEPDSRSNRSVNQQFRQDVDPDEKTNNLFTGAVVQLDSLTNIYNATNFDINDAKDQKNYSFIKSLLPELSDLNKRALNKIKRTSRKTVTTLMAETNALSNVLSKCISTSSITGENIGEIYSLMVDMNILLSGITDRKLQIPQAWDHSYYPYIPLNYSLASYSISSNNDKDYKCTLSDDDPRKFNIYIFRRGLVKNGEQNPEMKIYKVSYVIPALAGDKEAWEVIPDPASTVHCYFAPARFKFTITDTRSGEIYSATEDLYDAQKDPNEKWTIMDLLDRHPTYKLIFLIP